MKKILIIVIALIAIGAGVSAYAAETQKDNTNSNNTIVQQKENINTSTVQNSNSKSINSSNNDIESSNSKINNNNIDSSTNTNNSKEQNSNTKDLSQNNNTNSSTNDQYIIKDKIYINKFANYNGKEIPIYSSLLPKPILLKQPTEYGYLSGPEDPIYIEYKYLVEHNGYIQTWYRINYRTSLHGTATGYVESSNLFSNLSNVGDVNTCPDVNMKTGVNTGASPNGR